MISRDANHKTLTNIPNNATTHRDIILAGSLTADGKCEEEFYDDRYRQGRRILREESIPTDNSMFGVYDELYKGHV